MKRPRALDQSGLTLMEVMVVGILATLVMAGLVGFYLASQGTWFDASTQAITQREATFIAQTVSDSVRKSAKADFTPSPDAEHAQLSLYRAGDASPYYYFWWNPADSSVHSGTALSGGGDFGPMVQSKVTRFAVTTTPSQVGVVLELRTPAGQSVMAVDSTVMMNR